MTVRITICGSMSFVDDMEAIACSLRSLGYTAVTPIREERDFDWSDLTSPETIALKRSYIDRHLEKIRDSDAVLIANFSKRGVEGYVGPNTLMEAAFAHAVGIPVIFLENPSEQAGGLECIAIAAGCLNGDVAGMRRLLKSRSVA